MAIFAYKLGDIPDTPDLKNGEKIREAQCFLGITLKQHAECSASRRCNATSRPSQ